MKAIRAIFSRIDKNQDGTLSKQDVQDFLKDAGVGKGSFLGGIIRGAAAKKVVDNFDKDGDSVVAYEEFKGEISRKLASLPGKPSNTSILSQANEMFSKADKNSNGSLDKTELQSVVSRELGGSNLPSIFKGILASSGTDVALAMLDLNGDKQLDKSEVESILKDSFEDASFVEPGTV